MTIQKIYKSGFSDSTSESTGSATTVNYVGRSFVKTCPERGTKNLTQYFENLSTSNSKAEAPIEPLTLPDPLKGHPTEKDVVVSLDFSKSKNIGVAEIAKYVQAHPSLHSIKLPQFGQHQTCSTIIKEIIKLSQLEELEMRYSRCTNEDLKLISEHCPKLRKIDITCYPNSWGHYSADNITFIGVQFLVDNCHKLKEIRHSQFICGEDLDKIRAHNPHIQFIRDGLLT